MVKTTITFCYVFTFFFSKFYKIISYCTSRHTNRTFYNNYIFFFSIYICHFIFYISITFFCCYKTSCHLYSCTAKTHIMVNIISVVNTAGKYYRYTFIILFFKFFYIFNYFYNFFIIV